MYHTRSLNEIFQEFNSSESGLTRKEAKYRLERYGFNKLPEAKTDSLIKIFLRQFQSPLIYILAAAALIVFYLGAATDSLIILAVLVFNAVVGTIQEGKAQNTLAALKKFVETKAAVLRDGKEIIIPDYEVVPGDIIILDAGEKVPADARVIRSANLKIDQSAFTGESLPVLKVNSVFHKENLPISERKNMVFKGTQVVAGSGEAVVVSVGVNTEIGKIGQQIALIDTEMPLKREVKYLSRLIIITVSGVGGFLFLAGIALDKSFREMFATVVALSVSIIPEGLPIVMTLVLATGVWRMSKRNALVKRLQAIEALGQAKTIALDKTGTITRNELVVKKAFANNRFFEVSGAGYEPKGEFFISEDGNKPIFAADYPELILAGKIAGFSSMARVFYSEEHKTYEIKGDPTEAALVVFAEKLGFHKEIIEVQHPVVFEIPFDYKTKYHLIVRRDGDKSFLAVSGAPEEIFKLSSLKKEEADKLEKVFHAMSKDGLRVLALAHADLPQGFDLKKDGLPAVIFGGFLGIRDDIKEGVRDAIERASAAGIKVILVTGDHKLTAEAIARDAGIFKEGDGIISGEEIEAMSDGELSSKIDKAAVFARVSPEHKLRIIECLRKKGEQVAMTGDGVNDAPSLAGSDLGIAMGKIGTEVAKESADIILLDDNFSSIIAAIEEGRSIYKTIKKVILYLFSTSVGEVLTIAGAILSGYPLPILPGQIIWLNFITDGFLDVALAMEPKEKNLLQKTWRQTKHLVDSLMLQRMIFMALPMAAGSLFIFQNYLAVDPGKAATMTLTTLAIFQWFNVINCRSEDKSIFQINPFSNKYIIGALAIVLPLQLLAVYNPVFQKILHTVPLKAEDWLYAFLIAVSIILAEEIRKLSKRLYKRA